MNTPAPDYGEPWKWKPCEIRDRMDFVVGRTHSQDTNERIVACCNALAGVQDPDAHLASLNAAIERWESELSAVMPPDFKDWHENAKSEWPEVSRRVIESLRDREEWATNVIQQQAATLESAIELIRRVSTGQATPNDAWEWLKQHSRDKYEHTKH